MQFAEAIITLLASNLVLTQALGISTLFAASENKKKLLVTSAVITLFTTIGASAVYGIDALLGREGELFTLLCYTAVVALMYVIVLAAMYFSSEKFFAGYKKFVHLSAYNCAVMGAFFTIHEKSLSSAEPLSFTHYLLMGVMSGIGFIIAALILSAAHGRLTSSKIPSSFRGFPAMLVYLGIISMSLYALEII